MTRTFIAADDVVIWKRRELVLALWRRSKGHGQAALTLLIKVCSLKWIKGLPSVLGRHTLNFKQISDIGHVKQIQKLAERIPRHHRAILVEFQRRIGDAVAICPGSNKNK